MKYGIYFAYWEKEWGADQLPYIKKVKELGFDVLEISLAAIRDLDKEKKLIQRAQERRLTLE